MSKMPAPGPSVIIKRGFSTPAIILILIVCLLNLAFCTWLLWGML